MAIDDNASYELTGYQVKDLAQKIRAKADSASLAAVATSGLYSDITGAPTIPTVYNGTLTIQQDGTTLGTFSANQSTDETINITGGGTTYTAGSGIDITNDEISVDTSVVATQTDLGNYVTLGTDQNITGEKTFVGNKRIKFKGTASNSKLGFTTFDQNNGETGFLEVEGASTASKKVRLGCYDQNSGGGNRDNYVGFQYYNTRASGGTVSYNLVCPPQYRGVSGTNSFAYIPVDFTDGTTTIRAGVDGILDLSSLIPAVPTVNDATLTIQQNGTTVDTFTANSSTDKTVDIQTITAETVAPAEEVGAITASMIDWSTFQRPATGVEAVVGKWSDGSTIYAQRFVGTFTTNTSSRVAIWLISSGIDRILRCEGAWSTQSSTALNHPIGLPFTSTAGGVVFDSFASVDVSAGGIRFLVSSNQYNSSPGGYDIVVYYTKTTD